ncbi:Na+/H+ antiporter NhaA [Chachezhania sediminis]|uniref:Na+/H+ antiporter NhaA n=1 Tax=Chachezhania sediminis TaxID=2599291 RepID=UPI00131EACEF|nr:Na+/H+ antiporter NhaA [Chachezhania sediminis]
MLMRAIDRFFSHEASGGILLMLSAALAMIVANSPLAPSYDHFLHAKVSVMVDGQGLEKTAIHWINDGLMAIFFFMVGLELKREMLEGKLKNPRDVVVPGIAAVGGMAMPAVIFAWFNWGQPTIGGWAIPAATDIAFALGILALVGSRAPTSLKAFLLTLAILDDLGAILIIALFYTADLKVHYLLLALLPLAGMLWMNFTRAHRMGPLILMAAIMWYFVLKSGVHATLAGVVAAFCVPLVDKWGKSPLHSLEHAISPYSLYVIVPIFAFANAGVSLAGMQVSDILSPVPLGIALGLILGKQLGVFGLTWVLIKLGLASLPKGAGYMHVYGVACLAGVGFTMSLFIGGLSYTDPLLSSEVKIGVLCGSVISAILGYTVLMIAPSAKDANAAEVEAEAATAH